MVTEQKVRAYYDTPMGGVEREHEETPPERHERIRRERKVIAESQKSEERSIPNRVARAIAPKTYRSIKEKGAGPVARAAIVSSGQEIASESSHRVRSVGRNVGGALGNFYPRFVKDFGYNPGAIPNAFRFNPSLPKWAFSGTIPRYTQRERESRKNGKRHTSRKSNLPEWIGG